MFEFTTVWQLLEFKLIVLFITVGLAIVLSGYLYKKDKK